MFANRVEIVVGDIRQPTTLVAAVQDVNYIICCTGTTALPSPKWDFDTDEIQGIQGLIGWGKIYLDPNYRRTLAKNSPEQVDAQGVSNLVAAAPKDLQRFCFCLLLRSFAKR